MIRIYNDNGVYAPVIICDICKGHIKNVKNGAIVSLILEVKSGEMTDFLSVHKGECQNKAEEQLSYRGKKVGWQELNTHLLYLCKNTGLTLKEMKKLEK